MKEGPEEEIVESHHGIVGLGLDPTGCPIPLLSEENSDFLPRFPTWVRALILHSTHCLSVCLGPIAANLSPKFIDPETSKVR